MSSKKNDPLEGWLTFSQAAKKYHIDPSTLRKAVAHKRFHEDEYRLIGKTYVVRESAMERLYPLQRISISERVNNAVAKHRSIPSPIVSKSKSTPDKER